MKLIIRVKIAGGKNKIENREKFEHFDMTGFEFFTEDEHLNPLLPGHRKDAKRSHPRYKDIMIRR